MPGDEKVPRVFEPKEGDGSSSGTRAQVPSRRMSDDSDTSSGSSEEFDWDEDEEQKSNVPLSGNLQATRGRKAYMLFMRLSRFIRVLLLGILGAGVLITPLLIFQFQFLDSPARDPVHVWSLWFAITWAAGCMTYLGVDALPRITIWLIQLFGGHVERRKTQIELVFVVRAWIKLVLDVGWAWIILSVIRSIRNPTGSYWVVVNRAMQALFASSIIILLEKVFLRYVAINFHQKALADRLMENSLGLKALDRLSNAQPIPSTKRARSTGSTDFLNFGHKKAPSSAPDEPDVSKRRKHPKKASNDRGRAVASVFVDQLGDAIGQVALKDSKFNKDADVSGLSSARRLARKLFRALSTVYPPREHLLVEDFCPYFDNPADAHQAFALFDKDGNGDISKKEMREAVQRIYRERKALSASLKDVGSAVAKLDAVLLCVAFVLVIFVCLLIFNRENTLESLVPLATIILGFSFVFGNSAQQLFESLLFIFSTHVFDVGDLVLIDDQPLFVREFGLFSTTFRRVDGQEIIAPNSLLASSKLIHNIRRSNSMWETTNLMVSYDTSLETIEQLRVGIQEYISTNNREWNGFMLNFEKMEYQNAITLIVAVEHRPNWQDWGGRWTRRTKLMKHIRNVLEQLDIRYTLPIQPVLVPHPSRGTGSVGDLGNAGSFQSVVPRAPPGLRAGSEQSFAAPHGPSPM